MKWLVFQDVCVVCIVLGHDFSHYTWWYLTSVFTSILLIRRNQFDQYYYVFMTIQFNVAFEVLFMSQFGCNLFDSTYQKIGPVVYSSGQFIMHFVASCIIAWWYPPPFAKSMLLQCMLGAGIYFTWAITHNPWTIYQCNVPDALKYSPFILSLCLVYVFEYISPEK